uniref:hypothetical protein n=1 Tax=Rheinheimera sp. TaxID=1869214 RepID=UPI004047A53A
MEFFVKRASLEDAKNVASLFNDYRVFYKQKSDMTVALEFISERLDKNESVIFFAQDAKGVLLILLLFLLVNKQPFEPANHPPSDYNYCEKKTGQLL